MQLMPRLTGESGSPWVATTRPFCTPTSTEQPTPQKRHAALSQRTLVDGLPACCASATTGMPIPAVAAAAATALVLMNSRLSMVISGLLVLGAAGSVRRAGRARDRFRVFQFEFQSFVGVFVGQDHAEHVRGDVHGEQRVGHRVALA